MVRIYIVYATEMNYILYGAAQAASACTFSASYGLQVSSLYGSSPGLQVSAARWIDSLLLGSRGYLECWTDNLLSCVLWV